jgi:GET complex subunit GET2
MLGMDRPGGSGGNPMEGAEDDPMMRMMMEMLGGGAGGNGTPGSGPGGFPFPGGANPFAQGLGQQQAQQQSVVPDRYASLWRLLHTAVALGLGLYIAVWTSFSGTRTEREEAAAGIGTLKGGNGVGGGDGTTVVQGGADAEFARNFFYAFATLEALLLTSRFFLDRGRAPPSGVLWSVSSFLPQPIRGYLETGLRYGQIFSTVKADILVCIFVLGVCSWLRS